MGTEGGEARQGPWRRRAGPGQWQTGSYGRPSQAKVGRCRGTAPARYPGKARGQLLSPRVEKFMLSEEEERKRDQEPQLRTRSLGDPG